jgi:asparagine synthase (glutamine-hydrolysing)
LLEGPFLLAWIDSVGSFHLATDKVGSRPCYYTAEDGFHAATELSALAAVQSRPEIDPRGVSDLLYLGHLAGSNTLLDGVEALPMASHLVYDGETVSVERYWTPGDTPFPDDGYTDRFFSAYREAICDVGSTTDTLGVWLSGGIDSRVTAGLLRECGETFDTLTYETQNRRDRDPAARVADALDVPNIDVHAAPGTDGVTTDKLVESIERGVEATDAAVQWSAFANLTYTFFTLGSRRGTVMEGGPYLGEDLWDAHLDGAAVDILSKKKESLRPERVASILNADLDPRGTLREIVRQTPSSATESIRALDGMRMLYAGSHMRSNIPQRTQVDTRVVTHGRMLDLVVRMPPRYRMGTVPLTGGRIPWGVPPIKLHFVRRIGRGLDRIPYDRTGIAPRWPKLAHGVGFALRELRKRRVGGDIYAEWYRSDDSFRGYIDDRLAAVGDRSLFDADAIEGLRREFAAGDDGLTPQVAALTGLEHWWRRTLDGRRTARPQRA